MTKIGDYVFEGCSGLTSVTIPNSVSAIGFSTFAGCTSLTTVKIGNGVTYIGPYAFQSCIGLKSIIIGSGVTEIRDHAFQKCINLTDVFCRAEDVPKTEKNAFEDSNISIATLHVQEETIEAYMTVSPWNQFMEIVALTGGTEEWTEGDLNHDGVVDAADVVMLVNIIAGKK